MNYTYSLRNPYLYEYSLGALEMYSFGYALVNTSAISAPQPRPFQLIGFDVAYGKGSACLAASHQIPPPVPLPVPN